MLLRGERCKRGDRTFLLALVIVLPAANGASRGTPNVAEITLGFAIGFHTDEPCTGLAIPLPPPPPPLSGSKDTGLMLGDAKGVAIATALFAAS